MARFAAFYSETSDLRYGERGWSTDSQTFGSPRLAVELAERWLAEGGRYDVNVQDLEERLFKVWPVCGTNTRTHTSADGRTHQTHQCVRQDLHSDGRCAEHTQGGTPPAASPLQLELLPA